MGHINVKQIHKLLYQYHFLFRYFCCSFNLNVLFVLLLFNISVFYIPEPCLCLQSLFPTQSRSSVKVLTLPWKKIVRLLF
jgi:hypothetical protein